jgi:hypothetical protein
LDAKSADSGGFLGSKTLPTDKASLSSVHCSSEPLTSHHTASLTLALKAFIRSFAEIISIFFLKISLSLT